jgi:hypothetical protein
MITRIPEGQICEAFDPRMLMPDSVLRAHGANLQPNTSCLALSYVYVEGKHGKRFLCDTHYYYELFINRQSYSGPNHSVLEIGKYIVNETERVKETFAKNITSTETLGEACFVGSDGGRTTNTLNKCTAETFVKATDKNGNSDFFCNFHFRKTYYRYSSNESNYEDFYDILDERYRMTATIVEESLNLKCI